MAKRFTDTEKWRDEWWGSLSNDYRMIWLYLVDSCSIAGIWKKDFRGLNFNCNTSVTEEEFLKVFSTRVMDHGTFFFIPKFIRFQCPKGLNSNKPAILSIVRELQLNNLTQTVNELFGNDYLIIKDKDKGKDKDRIKTKEREETKEKHPEIIIDNTEFKYHVTPEVNIEDKLLALDELYLDGQRPKWSHINFDFELNTFLEKVRGSPGHYAGHDTDGIRLAFQSQLRKAKHNTNGLSKKSAEIIDRRASFAKRHGTSPE
jgi:hypothetical protein